MEYKMGEDTCLNIIFDDRLYERYNPLMKELESQNIDNYRIWTPVADKDSVVRSINLSHKQIVSWAKKMGLKEVCIAEDDLQFTAPGAWEYFLSQKPDDYDIYLACTYIPPISNNAICGFHLYMVNERFYDTYLSMAEDKHIDTEANSLEGKFVFCYPFPALQRACWSANNRAVVNYNSVLKKEDIWQG